MADLQRPILADREIDQAITALKKGAYLLKYGRRGKPKFCPFRLSPDEATLIWYFGNEEKQLELRLVTRIIPGQRTAIFQRYPRPEKEYQSFSLLYNDRSLDLICKDKEEAEVWFAGLKALIDRRSSRKSRNEARVESLSSESPRTQRISTSSSSIDQGDTQRPENFPNSRLGKAFADVVSFTATPKSHSLTHSFSSLASVAVEPTNGRTSASDAFRISLSSAVSSSSQGSCVEDLDSSGDVFIWGEGTGDGVLGGGELRTGGSSTTKINSHLPKALELSMVLDVRSISCGNRQAMLVTKQGDIYSWGEEAGGRLGHGVEADISHPKLIETLRGMNIEMVACGEFHSCAVTLSGDLYTWGNGNHSSGLLGHGSEVSHWIPKKVGGILEGLQVSYVSCGPWHTALITSLGQLFTFGDGTFGALGHGNKDGVNTPREVEALKGLRTLRVACGVWHTAAIVEVMNDSSDVEPSESSLSRKLFTWGDGDRGQLGHGDNKSRLVPELIASLVDVNFSQVACGDHLTVALTTTGRVYTMGSTVHGQLGSPVADGKTPTCIEGHIADGSVEEISCGSHHVAALTSKSEVYTWGKGANGQLGHGDYDDRITPTIVDSLKDKQVKSIMCGSNFTSIICLHKSISGANNSTCSGCQNPFTFRRKRHNCYNCGLVFCKACSSRKSLKASLAPSTTKPYRVCDDCYTKLQRAIDSASAAGNIRKVRSGNTLVISRDFSEKENGGPRFRLSASDSFNMSGGRSSKSSSRLETNDNSGLSPLQGDSQRGSVSFPKSPISPFGNKFFSLSVPSSRSMSRSTSPLPGKSSPLRSSTPTRSARVHTADIMLDKSKHNRDGQSEEIKYLRAQVEELASKTQLLEAELAKRSRELKEAKALAADEAQKSNAAKEVIKSLSEQLKEMADRTPEEPKASSSSDSNADQQFNGPNHPSNETSVNSVASPKTETSNGLSSSVLPNGTKAQLQNSERLIQDEPGVYITIFTLPSGENELRRVRFSRKRFTEAQAQKWWAENGTKICQRHNIKTP